MLEPNFQPFPVLKTNRLLLRQMTLDDAPEIFFLRSNEEVLRYIGKEPATAIQQAIDFITLINDNIASNKAIQWGIALQEQPAKLIGNICFWNIQCENYRAEIGYTLHPDHWRKGLMKEAILEVVDYGFNSLQLHSIEAQLDAANLASAATLEATGFIREAHFKENFFFRGHFSDSFVYSRLK